MVARVMSMQMGRHDLPEARAGDNVGLAFPLDEPVGGFQRGEVLQDPASAMPAVYRFEGDLTLLSREQDGHRGAIFSGFRPQLFVGALEVAVTLHLRGGWGMAVPGDRGPVLFETAGESPVCIESGQGFIVREDGRTIGFGTITKLVD
jgi:elongation factor Tu